MVRPYYQLLRVPFLGCGGRLAAAALAPPAPRTRCVRRTRPICVMEDRKHSWLGPETHCTLGPPPRTHRALSASTALKRGNSTAALVVKKEGNETVLKVDKVAKNLTVDDDITVGFFTFVPTCLSANFVRTTCRGSTSSSWQAQH